MESLQTLCNNKRQLNCGRYSHCKQHQSRTLLADPKRPMRVSDSRCCPLESGVMKREEQDPAQVDEDGNLATMGDEGNVTLGGDYFADTERLAWTGVAMAAVAGVMWLAYRRLYRQ